MYHFLPALSGSRVRLPCVPLENIFSLGETVLLVSVFPVRLWKGGWSYEGADPARYRCPATAQAGEESPLGIGRGRAADSSGSDGLCGGILAVSFGDGPDARLRRFRALRPLASLDRAGCGVASHRFSA